MESMKKKIMEIEELINNPENIKIVELKTLFNSFLSEIKNRIESYIGDYPTFIEPVFLEENVKIGDDVLLGPNVYIGTNSEIGNYVEISNSIVFENVKIGENFKLENCIILKNSVFNFSNLALNNYILEGISNSENNIKKIKF
jgi:NDP-sugar pyrophosphorylase family protein